MDDLSCLRIAGSRFGRVPLDNTSNNGQPPAKRKQGNSSINKKYLYLISRTTNFKPFKLLCISSKSNIIQIFIRFKTDAELHEHTTFEEEVLNIATILEMEELNIYY